MGMIIDDIKQVVPADGWEAVFKTEHGEFREPVILWAVIISHEEVGTGIGPVETSDPGVDVVGLVRRQAGEGGELEAVNTISNFERYERRRER